MVLGNPIWHLSVFSAAYQSAAFTGPNGEKLLWVHAEAGTSIRGDRGTETREQKSFRRQRWTATETEGNNTGQRETQRQVRLSVQKVS